MLSQALSRSSALSGATLCWVSTFPGVGVVRGGLAIRAGTAAALAVGAVLSSYELLLASETSDSIRKLAHYEAASASVLDTFVGIVPVFGPGLLIGWQLGLGIAIGLQVALGIVPNGLAAKITSSPGSVVVFTFEYVLGDVVPSAIAEDALSTILAQLAEAMRMLNSWDPPTPSVLVAP